MLVIVKNRQTLTDVATEHLGDADRAIEVAILNGLDLDDMVAGSYVLLPQIDNYKQPIADLFDAVSAPISALNAAQAARYEDEWTLFYTTGLPASHG